MALTQEIEGETCDECGRRIPKDGCCRTHRARKEALQTVLAHLEELGQAIERAKNVIRKVL